MTDTATTAHVGETYIWDAGYPRSQEQERRIVFVSSCVESVAQATGQKASDVFRRMQRVGLIHDYLLYCYEALHTESRENVTKDVIETLEYWEQKKGVANND